MTIDSYKITIINGHFGSHNEMKKVAFDIFQRKNSDKGAYELILGSNSVPANN